MSKTVILNLSAQIIADFESCFDTKQKERAHLYQYVTQKLNTEVVDVFIKRNFSIKLIEDGKQIMKPFTLDEINFEQTELVSNPDWNNKDIAGQLEPYHYIVGDTLWKKINDWAKLMYIANFKYNDSVIDEVEKALSKLISDKKTPEAQIKLKKDNIEKTKGELIKNQSNECIESYTYNLFINGVIEKIQSSEKDMLDKEFAELNKPEEKKEIVPIPEILN